MRYPIYTRLPFLTVALFSLAMTACLDGSDQEPTGTTSSELEAMGPPMLGAHLVRGAKPGSGGTSSPDLSYGGGNIMTSVVVQPIFWGTSWQSASFVGDKVSGLTQEYNAFAGSHYANTNTEYTQADGSHVTSTSISVSANLFDYSSTPRHAPSTSTVLAEVCKNITNPTPNGYYPVYTDIPRGHASYCAWHSWGQCNGVNVQFGFFFSLDNDSGCDVADTTGSGRSTGLASLANVTGHEFSEMVTDPRGTGWTDSSGSENADKCAWVFDQAAQLNGSTWTIQGNWSNAAYDSNTGFPNRSGQNGCLYNK